MVDEHIISGVVSSTSLTPNITAYKRGDVGMVSIWGVSIRANAAPQTLGTLPVGYRPIGLSSSTYMSDARVVVYADGVINAFNPNSSAKTVYISVTYVLA